MRKLVLGIIAIGLAQFAFINYLGLDDPTELAAAPADTRYAAEIELPAELPADHADTATDSQAVEDGVFPEMDAEPERTPRVHSIGQRRSRPLRQGGVRTAMQRDLVRESSDADFETVVIRYHTGAKRSGCGSEDVARPKSRSLTAESSPVANRPWQVITTSATRFN
ncbi:MAG: hypothetical protein QUS14_04140 [Pyrinomonadaceae bacterium]|nr:hypothetical protein [Pyrinomonadaceae bacterium]